MSDGNKLWLEERILVLAPTAADAALSQSILADAGLACHVCIDPGSLCRAYTEGAGALLLTEEVLGASDSDNLLGLLHQQPPWSDVPILLLTSRGADSAVAVEALELLGNVTLLERPVRLNTLVSALRTALRARRRQYELRKQLVDSRRSEERLRLTSLATGVTLFEQDADLRYVWLHNPIPGYAAEGVVGRTEEEIDSTVDDRAALIRAKKEVLSTGKGTRLEVPERLRGGRRCYQVTLEPKLDADGRVVGLVGAGVDMTDRMHLEEALREADRRKNEFLAMLGHELRNPLAPLRSAVEALRRQPPDGEARERLYAMMERQVAHLSRLVDDLLDMSRITRGLVELRRGPVNLADVADQAAEMAAPALEARGHDLSVTLPHRPVRVHGDATRLTQVAFNLLNNATKYTDPGGRIRMIVERDGEQAVIRVRDTGTGMTADLVPKVFDLFTQGDRTPDRSQGGLGLGLTLVKRLVEMHGGTVEARSEGPGKGSEFIVRLPALPSEAETPPPARTSTPATAAQVGRALVVDDNFDVAEALTWGLEGLAREIKMVHSGAAAIEMAQRWPPDLILCDLGMPGMDGYETCRRLRQVPGLTRAVIVAVSGYGGEAERRKSQAAGFDCHLVKPASRATLEELVKSTAGR